MFSQIGVPVTGGALNGQRSPDSGQTTTSLPIGLANMLHEAHQHATNFDATAVALHPIEPTMVPVCAVTTRPPTDAIPRASR